MLHQIRLGLVGMLLLSLVGCGMGSKPANNNSAASANLETFKAKVVGVHDGDTITVLTPDDEQIKVRLAQIDAPEKAQAFGEVSKQNLSNLVFNKTVTVKVSDKDRYGRLVATIFANNTDANLAQVKKGMAWVYQQYAKDQAYFAAETAARNKRVGLWADAKPIAPWNFRKETPNNTAPAQPKFSCGTKRLCKDMSSCEEATFYLKQCDLKSLDSNQDGIPCEALCH